MISDEAVPLPDPAVSPTPPPRRGLLALLVGIVAWPRSTLHYLRDQGGRTWLLPLMLALGLTLAARAVAVPIERAEAEAALAALQEQIEAQNADGGGGVFIGGTAGPGGPVAIGSDGLPAASPLADYGLPALGVVWDWLLRGGALLGLAWVLGGRPSAGAMFRMSGWTLVPDIARLGVMLAVMLGTGQVPARGLAGFAALAGEPIINIVDSQASEDGETGSDAEPGDVFTFEAGPGSVSTGPGELPGPGALFAGYLRNSFLSAVDLYTLWALVLLAIGVGVTARLGWLKAALSSLLYFGLSVALAALPPLLSFWLLRFAGGGGPTIIR